ncbi:hypothetical protein L332_13420 [Agrococcus pavilionensis RW1]|uniref:Uncharacterized protein n=1 Tax=Agrococcus pavilionensis RW1 TaxID=1330458 RepID=U1MXZ9_9MICO|nr:type II toxin-antitoxin system Phd/YefM family antitoxin [Agrococcus pavilionensis]ERG65435.1 hypothetical protein L332_13420 [Agrococcus pavilionensis RW1]
MKTVSVRELRQNPAQMLRDVESGERCTIASYDRPIARVEPVASSTRLIPPKRTGRPNLASLPRHELRTAASIDELLDDLRGSDDDVLRRHVRRRSRDAAVLARAVSWFEEAAESDELVSSRLLKTELTRSTSAPLCDPASKTS